MLSSLRLYIRALIKRPMIEPVINETRVTPDWLTGTLLRNGHLKHGSVSRIYLETFHSFFANFYRLAITYSADAAPALPARLILKVPFADSVAALEMGREEVAAYRKLHEAMLGPPLVRCFDAAVESETGYSHLLLEDLSRTHIQGYTPDDISPRQWELCVEALADLHAFWWESEALGTQVGKLFDDAEVEKIRKLQEESLAKFFAEMGGELSPEMQKTYSEVNLFLLGFWRRRLTSRRRNTLIHGDAHSWNFLFPKDVQQGRAFMIDLATLRARPATNDLAYLMALKWKPDRRARFELSLLRHYHGALVARGVQDFSWEDCLLDYRHSIVTHLFTPVVQCAGKLISAGIWRANFQRITAAYQDWNCAELISNT